MLHCYSRATLRHMAEAPSSRHEGSVSNLEEARLGRLRDLHGDVRRVLLVALQPDRVTSGAAGAQYSGIVCTDDEVVPRREGQVLRKGGGLINVVPGRSNTCQPSSTA